MPLVQVQLWNIWKKKHLLHRFDCWVHDPNAVVFSIRTSEVGVCHTLGTLWQPEVSFVIYYFQTIWSVPTERSGNLCLLGYTCCQPCHCSVWLQWTHWLRQVMTAKKKRSFLCFFFPFPFKKNLILKKNKKSPAARSSSPLAVRMSVWARQHPAWFWLLQQLWVCPVSHRTHQYLGGLNSVCLLTCRHCS